MSDLNALDLFAGPGGWDVAARELGTEPLGIEIDDAACETREAAGHRTLQADVAELDARATAEGALDLLIASPPCTAFSRAGKREGMDDMYQLYDCARDISSLDDYSARCRIDAARWTDPRSALVLEPLRFAVNCLPTFIAWEQVPDVLPFWQACAVILRGIGYQVWTGILEAERYGVPQTRERAILMAVHSDHRSTIQPPQPTHQRYVKGIPAQHEHTLEGDVLPWVSMAEALGKDEGPEPYPAPTVTAGGTKTGGPEVFASAASRRRASRAFRNGNRKNAAIRDESEPAPTLHFGHACNKVEWIFERPSPTITTGTARCEGGVLVYGDWRSGEAADGGGLSPVKVTLEEAAVLQSFPPDYPFQGTKSKRFEQVGNAVPPLLAHAVLSELLSPVLPAAVPDTERAAA